MKMLKKVIAIAMAAVLLLSVAACGKDGSTTVDGAAVLDENGFFKGIKASDYVTLPEYKGIEVPVGATTPIESVVQASLEGIASNFDTYVEITDRAVEDGDTVNIDFIGYLDGTQVSGTNTGGLGREYVIGDKITLSTIPVEDDFTEQLIGAMPGTQVTVTVTYPENGFDERARGKEVDFKVTVNHILGDVIKAPIDDAMAQSVGYANLASLTSAIEEGFVGTTRFNFFVDLIKTATCEVVPESVVNFLKNDDLAVYEYEASMYGMTTEEYLNSYYGYESLDAYVEEHMESYRANAVLYLAAQAIAEKEKLMTTDADLVKYTETRGDLTDEELKQYVLFQEILPKFVAENGIPTDMPKYDNPEQ